MKARTHHELILFLERQPCGTCGDLVRESALQCSAHATSETDAEIVYQGVCARCGAMRRFVFQVPRQWPAFPSFRYGGDEPSQLLSRAVWIELADTTSAGIPEDPSKLDPTAFFANNGALVFALAQLAEANKLEASPDIAARVAKLRRIRERYVPLMAEMAERRKQADAGSPAPATFDREALLAHEQWVERGRKGAGRLVLEGASLGGLALGNAKLSGARFMKVSFDRARIDFAKLDGAELIECSARLTDFAHTNFDDARLDRCDLEHARLVLTDLKDVKVRAGSMRGANADRGAWNRISLNRVDLRELRFGDCVLDGALLEDCDLRGADLSRVSRALTSLCSALNTTFRRCDLRGAKLEGRRFNGTKFIDCKLAGVQGKPVVEGRYLVERPDFSAAGDGSDLRGASDVYALWGTPK